MSPQIRLKRVVLPAPFGPSTARRSPCTTSRSTSRTASNPPKRRPTPRKRRVGAGNLCGGQAEACPPRCFLRCSLPHLMTELVTTSFFTARILPCHGSFFFTHGGCVRPGGGLDFLKSPPNDWSTFGT